MIWVETPKQVQPLAEHLLLGDLTIEVHSPEGIIQPEQTKNIWEVVAVGPDVKSLKVGQCVMLGRQAVMMSHLLTPVLIAGKNYYIAKEQHICAAINISLIKRCE